MRKLLQQRRIRFRQNMNESSMTVTPQADGYVIILRPGDHQKVTHKNRYFVPYDSVIPSGDDNFHICLHPTEEHENCFFAPSEAM